MQPETKTLSIEVTTVEWLTLLGDAPTATQANKARFDILRKLKTKAMEQA